MVLIDGKPTILDPSDVLRQIPSSSIENIEIITNPSVKYDPDGATGIINIITKKNPLEGVSGIVNANVGTFEQYGGDFQLSYRVSKFNFILGANHNKRPTPGSLISERFNLSNDTAYHVNSSGEGGREFINSNIRGGIEYDLSKTGFHIDFKVVMGAWAFNNGSTLFYNEFTFPETQSISYKSIDETTREGIFGSFDAIYQKTFKKKETVPDPKAVLDDPAKAVQGGSPMKKRIYQRRTYAYPEI